MKLTKSEIKDTYSKIKIRAFTSYENHDYEKTIFLIRQAASIASLYNWKYVDDELETLLKEISLKIFSEKIIFEKKKNRIVFYDFQALDNSCLTQQYLRALMSWNAEILYIPERNMEFKSIDILEELSNYSNVTILKIDNSSPLIEKLKYIQNKIIEFKPDKIFLQLAPNSVEAVVLFNSFPNIEKYYIDLNDHTFWLGTSCTDYVIEFRNRGYTVAKEKRGFKDNQIFLLPYYPIVKENIFLGLPSSIKSDNIILFSGGNYYKVIGQDNTYFKIAKQILDENPTLVFLYAGMGIDTEISDFIVKNNFQDRFFLLGFRKDINELFENIDIYMNTYPFSGGLMCQYAALKGKPIIAFNTSNRESDFAETVVCDSADLRITFTNKDELFKETKRLVNDIIYRKSKGNELKKCIITPLEFNNELFRIITDNQNIRLARTINIDYDSVFERYFQMINKKPHSYIIILWRIYGMKSVFMYFPKLLYMYLGVLIKPKLIINRYKK